MHTISNLSPTCLEVKQHSSDIFTSIGETEGSRQRWEYISLVLRHCLCLVTFRRIGVHSYNVIIHDINIRRFHFVDNFPHFLLKKVAQLLTVSSSLSKSSIPSKLNKTLGLNGCEEENACSQDPPSFGESAISHVNRVRPKNHSKH